MRDFLSVCGFSPQNDGFEKVRVLFYFFSIFCIFDFNNVTRLIRTPC